MLNSARARILFTGTLVKKIQVFENHLALFFKTPKTDFNLVAFFETVQKFKHKKMLNYKVKNDQGSGLKITFNTFEFFPSMGLLFSFLKHIKTYI